MGRDRIPVILRFDPVQFLPRQPARQPAQAARQRGQPARPCQEQEAQAGAGGRALPAVLLCDLLVSLSGGRRHRQRRRERVDADLQRSTAPTMLLRPAGAIALSLGSKSHRPWLYHHSGNVIRALQTSARAKPSRPCGIGVGLDRFFSAGSKRSLTVSSTYLQSSRSPNVEVSPSNPTSPLRDFETSSLDGRIIKTLQATRMLKPTPIQAHAIPLLIAGHDVMASSHTGSGKTLMFGLPLLQSIIKVSNKRGNGTMGRPSALVIAPTRELAIQIEGVLKSFKSMQLNICLATGGSDTRQQRQRLPSCHVLVGTPGRIVQFIDERNLSLGDTDFLVIDEADRLLDLGFEKELTRIARSISKQKQSVLCSATFPEGVQRLAADFLRPDYYFVSVGRVGSTQSNIRQRFEWVDTYAPKNRRPNNTAKVEAVTRNVQRFWRSNPPKTQNSVVVFCNTKDGAEEYGRALLSKFKNKQVRVIHGDKPQSERNSAIRYE